MPTSMADSVVVDVPADVAWAFVSDPRRVHSVVPNTTVAILSGSFETVGSRYLVTTRAPGQTLDATHEIVRYEPPRLIETRTTSQGTVGRSLMQVEPVRDGACALIVQGEIEWGGTFTALVSRVVTALAGRKTFAESLERLKRAIESDAARVRVEPASRADPEAHLGEER